MPATDTDVIGCGPAGVVWANLLGEAGCRAVVPERDLVIHPIPRATHVGEETLRNLQATDLMPLLAEHVEVVGLEGPQGAVYVAARGRDGAERRLSAAWGVGCDDDRSFARGHLDVAWELGLVFGVPAVQALARPHKQIFGTAATEEMPRVQAAYAAQLGRGAA